MKARSFFFHYNKPESLRRGKPVISLHFKSICHMVDNVVCKVATEGRLRKSAPRFVMAGKAAEISINDGVATIQ